MDENKLKHLELLQGVIVRLAGNSFFLKGWTVTLVAALFALSAQSTKITFTILALFPALCFWGLDAYYLKQERMYRALYEEVCGDAVIRSLNTRLYSLDVAHYTKTTPSWFKTLFTPTIALIHGTSTILVIVVIILSFIWP